MSRTIPPLPAEDHVCDGCGFAYPELDVTVAGPVVSAVTERVRAAFGDVADLRRRPSSGTWSALEYGCHLRDVYVSSTIRLYRVRTEDSPRLEPMLNDLRAARFGYNELDPRAVLNELGLVVGGFLDELARVRDDGWGRTASRLPGEVRTARWLVRNAAHEGRHHVLDIEALGTAG